MNSSDWIAKASANPQSGAPAWMAAIGEPAGFSAASPFAHILGGSGDAALNDAQTETQPATPTSPDETEWDRGFAAGEIAGRNAAKGELDGVNDQKMALRTAFRALDQAAMDALASALAETVIALCDDAMKDHAINPDALAARAKVAAQRLGSAAQMCTLHLHPDDLELIEESAIADWNTVPDPVLERGTIAMIGPEGGVRDGPAEWRRAIGAALRG